MKPFKSIFIFCLLFLFLNKTSFAQKEKDFRVSLGYDPKMKLLGPYETSEEGEWNLLFRFAHRRKHMEYTLFLETFDAISYGALGVGVNYLFLIKDSQNRFNRWEFGIGPGFGVIVRKELDVKENFFELNGEFRYFFNKNLGLTFLGNL